MSVVDEINKYLAEIGITPQSVTWSAPQFRVVLNLGGGRVIVSGVAYVKDGRIEVNFGYSAASSDIHKAVKVGLGAALASENKVIILDIDGPMIPGRWVWQRYNSRIFDPCAANMLLNLLKGNNVKIALCSVWRKDGYEKVCKFFKANGIDPSYFHEDWRTKQFEDRTEEIYREDEIKEWLSRHPEVTHYCVIDDELHDVPGMVHVTFRDGMLWEHFLKAKELLDVTY